mmetsp:Transcript_27623/g.67969  ORF Transcript_27623/g.67969 Transcript_27623/m.67969 type:complete len:240 (+) Transcript_27623:634-1353(+)
MPLAGCTKNLLLGLTLNSGSRLMARGSASFLLASDGSRYRRREEHHRNHSLPSGSTRKCATMREMRCFIELTSATWSTMALHARWICSVITVPVSGADWLSCSLPSNVTARSCISLWPSYSPAALTRRSMRHTLGDHAARMTVERSPLGTIHRWHTELTCFSPLRRKCLRLIWSKYSMPMVVSSRWSYPGSSLMGTLYRWYAQNSFECPLGSVRRRLHMASTIFSLVMFFTFFFLMRPS